MRGEEPLRPAVRAAGGRVVAAWHHQGNRVLSSASHDARTGWTRLPDVQAPRPSPYHPGRMPTPHDLALDGTGSAFLVWMDEPETWWSRLRFGSEPHGQQRSLEGEAATAALGDHTRLR